jgi:hypothetical protein
VPTEQQIISLIVGPFGAIVVLCVTIFFLWKLYREEQAENRSNFKTVATLTEVIRDQTTELKHWREAGIQRGGE